jgi:hypothetical protein
MPEYLSPGVYIEEFEIGAKPIEGVSTSTAGFVGFAERGPLNIPTLVTSFAEYQSIFGGYLPKSTGDLRWLAYAVEAFFNNGGQRVYVTRVAKRDTANAATGFIPDLKGDTSISLKKDVPAGAITLQISDSTGFVPNDVLYLSDGPNSEYLIYVSRTKVLILDRPLDHTITRPTTIQLMNDSGSTTISKTTVSGTKDIFVTDITQFTTPDLAAGDILIIEDSSKSESCIVQSSAKDPDPKKSGKIIVTANLSYVHNVTASVTVSIKIVWI